MTTAPASGFQLTHTGPGAYERYMVPAHCVDRAEDLLNRVNPQPREHVLDVACGTGIVARLAARRVGDAGRVAGVELNPAMLEIAQKMSAYQEPVEFMPGDAMSLPVEDASFDVALCQHSIMFFPDRAQAVREMYRAVKPGGRVAVSAFRTTAHNPAFKYLLEVLERHADADAVAFMQSPFVMESVEQMRGLFAQAGSGQAGSGQAGFSEICVTNRIVSLRYPSIEHFVRNETLNIPDPSLHTPEKQQAMAAMMSDLAAAHVDDHGVVFPAEDYVVVATR